MTRKRGGPLSPYEKYYCWDTASNCVIYNTAVAYMPSVSCVFLSSFNFSFAVTKNKLRQTNTYEDDFTKVNTYIAFNFEIRIDAQFKNILTNCSRSDILEKNISVAAYKLG